jgi:DNA-binding response OmpR family regulator
MKQYTLLIIDDEQRYADLLAKRLELRGCVCEVCYTGAEALKLFATQSFSLIILDLRLPDVHGTELLTKLKKNAPDTPVIILTGHGSAKDRSECLQKGADDFLHKPLDIDRLMAILARVKKQTV